MVELGNKELFGHRKIVHHSSRKLVYWWRKMVRYCLVVPYSQVWLYIHIMVVFAPFSLQLLEKCYRKLIILVICASFVSIFIAKHQSIQGYLEKHTTNSILVPREYNYTDINYLSNVTREWISQKRISLRSNNYWVLYNHIKARCSILAHESWIPYFLK